MYKATQAVSRLLKQEGEVRPLVTREELQLLLREEGGGSDINPLERDLIRRIFRFSTTRVKEAMIPLVDVVALETCTMKPLPQCARKLARYPVYRDRVDNVVGICIVWIFWMRKGRRTIRPLFVILSGDQAVDELLELQRSRDMARWWMSTGTVGIVTVEILMVGGIENENNEPPFCRRIGPKNSGSRPRVDHLNEILKLGLPRGDYETLGGFVLERLGRVPLAGEVFRYKKMLFEILKSSEKSVLEVAVTLKE
jgi:CBS domain containing-hemolysin-like protein